LGIGGGHFGFVLHKALLWNLHKKEEILSREDIKKAVKINSLKIIFKNI